MKVCYKVHGTDLYAVFPEMNEFNGKLCYAHMGQHGVANDFYIRESRNATPNEYAELHQELSAIYAPERLDISKRMTY